MDSGIDDEYPDRKSPMYDEISLPFIDASLPPTPKIGRVVNGLDILLGRENSQVGEFYFFLTTTVQLHQKSVFVEDDIYNKTFSIADNNSQVQW